MFNRRSFMKGLATAALVAMTEFTPLVKKGLELVAVPTTRDTVSADILYGFHWVEADGKNRPMEPLRFEVPVEDLDRFKAVYDHKGVGNYQVTIHEVA